MAIRAYQTLIGSDKESAYAPELRQVYLDYSRYLGNEGKDKEARVMEERASELGVQ